MKRFWSLALACCMVLSMLPVGAAAGDGETIASGGTAYFDWVLDSQGVLTVKGSTIPDYASSSNMPWYDYRDQIRKVVLINSGSVSIGSNAFYGCSNLETVELPQKGCAKIGAYAFANCSALKKMVLWDHGISMTIGSGAFMGCTGLETLGIPHYATLESNAFASCKGLSDIYITSSYTQTFSGWDAAEDSFNAVTAVVHYPTGMGISSYIGNESYGAQLTWTETAEGFCGNHTLWTYDETARVLTISGSGSPAAFLSGSYTPWTNLRSDVAAIVVEEGVTELPSYFFEYLAAVTQVQLPDTLTVLAPNAFNNCSALKDLYIPGSVTAFVAGTDFNRCTALTDLYYPGTAEEWAAVENGADAITEGMTLHTLVLQSADATCTENGTEPHYRFDDYASGAYPGYYNLDKQPMGQPETIPAQGHTDTDGNRNCDSCGAAICSNHVLEYRETKKATCQQDGYVAHWHCAACDRYYDDQAGQHETNAQNIRIQDGDHSPVTDAAVAPTCTETGLTEGSHCGLCGRPLTAQTEVPSLGHAWGEGKVTTAPTCTAEGVKTYTCQNDADHTKTEAISAKGHTDQNSDLICDSCGTDYCGNHGLVFAEAKAATCQEDGYLAHWYCRNCGKLYTDADGKQETTADGIALRNGDHSPVTDAAVAPTCTKTGLTEGSHCGLCSQTLTAQTQVPVLDHDWQSTTDVFTQQCSGCQTARTITLTGKCGLYDADEPIWTLTSDGTLTISGAGVMANYTYSPYQDRILRVVIEEGVTSTDAAFRNFTNLVSAVLPDSLTNVNQLTFSGCTALEQVDLGEGVTSLQLGTFGGCSVLKTLDIPDSVTSIGNGTFTGCTALETLTIGSGITAIEGNTFYSCTNLKTVTIDTYEEAVTLGENAFHQDTEVIFLRKKPASLVFDGGSGTPDDPYRVSNAQQLNAVRDYPEAHYIQTADIDLSGMNWTPIGGCYHFHDERNDAMFFTGSYNGQDHSITGMTITGEYTLASETLVIGLFGGTDNASISSLHLSGGKIDITVNAGSSALCMGYIGGVAGCFANITDCSNDNDIKVTVGNYQGSGEPFYLGGIGGYGNTISGCSNSGSITAVSVLSGVAAGGIAGCGPVQTSWNSGNVSVDCGTYDKVGGIVGELSQGVVHQCCNTGNISGKTAGGIAGSSWGTIENCFNAGTVTSAKAGGIVSYQRGTVTHCYNAGDVTGGGAYPASAGISYDNDRASVTDLYYLDNVTAGTVNGTDCGIRCTSRQLAEQSTFENFDFQYIWKIEPNADYPYPTLRALEAQLPDIQRRWGACGENVFWQLDEDGTLTISGTGSMYDYTAGTRPWEAFCDEVVTVVVEMGLTRIPVHAFSGCTALKTAYIEQYQTQVTVEAGAFDAGVTLSFKTCAQEHSWGAGGCTDKRTCTICGAVEEQARGHQTVTDLSVAPTCNESGLTEGAHCGVCGAVLTAQETIPAAGHSWDEGKVTLAPTCQAEGVKTFTCLRDGSHIKTETLATVSHGDEDHDGKCDHCQQTTGFTVTFVTNGGTPVPEAQLAAPGGYVSEPEAPQRENYTFRGWFLEGEDGERWKFDQYTVEGDLTLYAKWHKAKHNVHGYVHKHGGGKPDHKVKVYLQQGGKTICELETDEHGFYRMEGIPAGCYNLLVKEHDGRSRTTLVEIWEDGQMERIELPEHNVSTEIRISDETREAILVNGLDQVADSNADRGGHHVKVTMKVGKTDDFTEHLPENEDEKAKKKAQEAIKNQVEADNEEEREYVFLDIEIEKQMEDGEHTEITDTDGLLEIRVPVETHGRRHFKVYRHHGDQVHELGETRNEHGEHIEIHEGYVIIYARKFSTYAVTSLAADEVCQHDFQTRYVWTEQGCDVIRDCKYCEEQQEEPVMFTREEGVLKLSAVPDGLTLMVVSYDADGRMTGCQLMTRLQTENPITVSGDTVKVFLLNSAFAPRMTAK